MSNDERLKIAVFIDFDNIEIGVKTTLGGSFDVGAVLEAVKERGEVVTKVAYGDWTRATDYGRSMSQHAIHMVQRNLTPGGDKNGADINLALDALEMAFTHNHINAFVIVGGDSDFITLVEKLKQYDRKVFVVGGRSFTSQVMQKNCTEFMAYEDILGLTGRARHAGGRIRGVTEVSAAMPLVRRASKLLADREMTPQLGLLKSTLLQLDSSFSERAYGASSFRDFVEKLAKAGHVAMKGGDRSVYVELREAGEPGPGPAEPPEGPAPAELPRLHAVPSPEAPPAPDEPRLGPAEGYRVMAEALSRTDANPRFPMYVRQFKHFMKAFDEHFDERRYGFAGILDALRFAQREGLVRLDRDRRGGVRVHPGTQYLEMTKSAPPAGTAEPAASETARPELVVLEAEAALPDTAPPADEAQPVGEPQPFESDVAVAAPPAPKVPPSPTETAPAEPVAEPEPAPAPRGAGRKRAGPRTGARAKRTTPSAGGVKKRAPRPRAKKPS